MNFLIHQIMMYLHKHHFLLALEQLSKKRILLNFKNVSEMFIQDLFFSRLFADFR